MKHFTIPVFVPEQACPNRCVFCNQHSISGCISQPDPDEVRNIVMQHLQTIPEKDSHIEIGFFGGSFTGIEPELQERYLAVANEFLIPESGISCGADTQQRIHGIRLSTRPDYIDNQILQLLNKYKVDTIELGAQSLDEEVLRLSGRGHTVEDVERASAMIRASGFRLGLQMMTGLPGDTPEKSIHTAKRIIELGADCTRIYPTLVIKGTDLEKLWLKGEYQPQTLQEAIELTSRILQLFEENEVEVIRVGLHPSEGLIEGKELLAGPFHPSFRELVHTFIWRKKLLNLLEKYPGGGRIFIPVSPSQLRHAIGYNSENLKMLQQHFEKVEFFEEDLSSEKKPVVIVDKKMPLPAKNSLKSFAEVHFLESEGIVYKTISGHPDIFLCQGREGIVAAPSLPEDIRVYIERSGISVFSGYSDPQSVYPGSAKYNAVVTDQMIIHNLKITDPAIIEAFPGREQVHVNQGYTRCNLLALGNDCFITSDRGIEKILTLRGKRVMFAEPESIILKGQKHGFFPGCCGLFNGKVLINGALSFHPQGEQIRQFILESGWEVQELFIGKLFDVGGIFVIDSK